MAFTQNRKAPYGGLGSLLALKGRQGDTELVHMSKPEVTALSRMGKITRNPDTGFVEAFNLNSAIQQMASMAFGNVASDVANMAISRQVDKKLGQPTTYSLYNSPNVQIDYTRSPDKYNQVEMKIPFGGGPAPMPKFPELSKYPTPTGMGREDVLNMTTKSDGGSMTDKPKVHADDYVADSYFLAALGNGDAEAGSRVLNEVLPDVEGDSETFDGYIPTNGSGDGMSDDVEFEVIGDNNIKRAFISGGEEVIDGKKVELLGGGSVDDGSDILDDLRKYINKLAYGQEEQPNQINSEKAATEFLNKKVG